jgi:symplekin
MHRTRVEVFDESNRKRPAPVEPTDGLDPAKRQRLVVEPPSRAPSVQPLPPGDVSWRQLYTLNNEGSTANFDVQAFKDPEQLLRIVVPVLQHVNAAKLEQAINVRDESLSLCLVARHVQVMCNMVSCDDLAPCTHTTHPSYMDIQSLMYTQIVRSRYQTLRQTAASQPSVRQPTAPAAEDEEEYEPDFEPEDAEQLINKLDGIPSDPLASRPGPSTALAPYKLPEAPPLSEEDVQKYGDMTVRRAFGMLSSVDETQKSKATKGGFNRLAASDYNRDAWVTILSRLATRASAGLDDPEEGIKDEYAVKSAKKGSLKISDAVRDGLYQYIMYDWKKRIDVAISWLNEEWYNDMILAQSASANGTANGHTPPQGNYHRCALRLIDGILPYIEHTDKILVRFLSEIPAIDYEILVRLKKMAEDPERIDLACYSLQYLYMFRPPVKKLAADVLSEMWTENERAKPSARKLLARWRPELLGEDTNEQKVVKMEGAGEVAKESANGVLEVKAAS